MKKFRQTLFTSLMQPTALGRRCLDAATALGTAAAFLACEGGGSTKQPGARPPSEPAPPRQETPSPAEKLPEARRIGNLEVVATFHDQMPTGVTVSRENRVFVSFPRWGDPVRYTVAEVKDGKAVAYPSEDMNRGDVGRSQDAFVSVQSVVVDPNDRLWVLDTGSIEFGPVVPGGAKLVGIDLATNRVVQTISFPPDIALPTTYLNDVRFDLTRGAAGMAFITDSSSRGPNGIIVVDLASGRSSRRLNDHPSTKPEEQFAPFVEGSLVMQREPGKPPQPLHLGSDGIAIGAHGKRLFYCPLSSRKLYSVSLDALADERVSAVEVYASVVDHGEKGASDGLEADAQGAVYATSYEQNAVVRRQPDGSFETLIHDPRLLWPDTLSLADDGYLYVIANQLHRQPRFHGGKDLRERPFVLFRVQVGASPVRLRR
ncbi:L-dopachrome tautomerase-related protein [Sorangium sp. So ce388]|uniref:L-dopachrome tautomerase-related protein n=1 Tax=Sorangium sp. So ce388 TaxID=3133309 RepID=UPI003F5B3381